MRNGQTSATAGMDTLSTPLSFKSYEESYLLSNDFKSYEDSYFLRVMLSKQHTHVGDDVAVFGDVCFWGCILPDTEPLYRRRT